MGVQIYLLDRRSVTVRIGGYDKSLGALRRFFKITELDSERGVEIEHVKETIRNEPAPTAVMLASADEVPFASLPELPVSAHLVVGWDPDRPSIADTDIKLMPTLGYAVRSQDEDIYVLFEKRDELLYPMPNDRAIELGILTLDGVLVHRGEPEILECHSVRPFIPNFAIADCILASGRKVEVMTRFDGDSLPAIRWYIGKRPSKAANYHAVD